MSRAIDPLKSANFRTQRAELPEDLWQPLYDRVNYPTGGSTNLGFYSNPLGQSATLIQAGASTSKTKTYRDTNMQNSNVVPTKMFRFEGISIAYIHAAANVATNALDRENIRTGGYLQFRIVDKDIIFLPLVLIPEVNPLIAASTTANNTTINSYAGGGGGIPMYKLPVPIVLNPYESFQVSLLFDGTITTNAAAGCDIQVFLQGFMRRPT